MSASLSEQLPIRSENDIVMVRQRVRARAAELRLGLVEQTKIVTAASELARNTLIYGRGGVCRMEILRQNPEDGIRLTFEDEGPGIPDVAKALSDGFTSGSGLGMGLGGSRRLVNEFEIHSEVGRGTRVTVTKWRGR